MYRKRQRQSFPVLIILGIIGLVSLPFLVLARKKETPQEVIYRVLTSRGVSPQTAKYWTAISAFETAYQSTPWNSPVLKDTNNLFNIIVPGSKRLNRGEGQTIYSTWEEGVNGLYDHVIKPFNYPRDAASLEALVEYQKKKGYFVSGLEAYKAGTRYWYDKLFPNG